MAPWPDPYASDADLLDYSDVAGNYSPEDRAKALERAQRDVDLFLGGRFPRGANGQRFSPSDPNVPLSSEQLDSLRWATCAQAEWRLVKGVDYFLEYESGTIHGPDFTIDGVKHRYFSPKAIFELRSVGLFLTGARAVP